MKVLGRALIASAFVLGVVACAGGDSANAGDTGTAAAAGAGTGGAGTPAGGAATPAGGAATGTAAAAPITGQTHDVRMVFDGTAYKYEPADITIKAGDGIRWTMVSGPPHNVNFSTGNPPADVATQLAANMPQSAGSMQKMGPLVGPYLMNNNETYTVSFANIKPGKYEYVCDPHVQMGMRGSVTVQ
jgi:plastocyanin